MSPAARRFVPTPSKVRGALAFILLFLVVVGAAMSLGSVSNTEPAAVDGRPRRSPRWRPSRPGSSPRSATPPRGVRRRCWDPSS